MTKIKGLHDGSNGRNENYIVGSKRKVKRTELVKEVEAGKHPGAHIYKRNRRKFVRDNPDTSINDNVNL